MIEAVIRALIYVCCLALVFVLVVWVLGTIGVAIPAAAIKILYVIFGLICILVLWRLLRPHAGNWLP